MVFARRFFCLLILESVPSGRSGHQEADPALTIGRGSGKGRPDHASVDQGTAVLWGKRRGQEHFIQPWNWHRGNEPRGCFGVRGWQG